MAITAAELKRRVMSRGTESYFFTRASMKFFGDTMRNYGVRGPFLIVTNTEPCVEVWELYRRKAVKDGLKESAYFRTDNYQRVFKAI